MSSGILSFIFLTSIAIVLGKLAWDVYKMKDWMPFK